MAQVGPPDACLAPKNTPHGTYRRDAYGCDAVLETYITHIRITEYSSHPSSPPPPQARTPQSEKPRVIIVAVRKSGRVRVHKSKENTNGTFSIGKTWDLNDLTAIDSFTDSTATPDFRQWAGNVGFVVLLGKPYYWQSQTDKEKKFFIASLLKIYFKYTGGKSPVLSGFDAQELEQIQGGAQRRAQLSQPLQGPQGPQLPPPLPQPPAPAPSRPPVPEALPNQGAYSVPPGNMAPPVTSPDFRTSARRPINGTSSPVGSFDSGRSANQAALRRLAGSNKSQESVSASLTARSDDGSLRPKSRNGPANGTSGLGAPTEGAATDERPPERRRPPMDPTRPQGGADDGLVPAPLSSTRSRDGVAPPPRNSERMSPRKASVGSRSETASLNDRYASGTESARADVAPLKSPLNGSFTASATRTPEPETPTDSAYDTEARPGLGPMIKKKSKGDIAGAFKRAAAAAGAFKPRPGGAGDRLRQAQKRSTDGPDGINGVVPAPARPISVEKPRPVAEERPPTPPPPLRSSAIPEVKVIQPPSSSRPSSLQSSVKEVAQTPAEPEPQSRRSIIAGNDVKYLSSLGIDPSSVLDSRSAEFTKWLDYFGWVPGEQMRSRNFDEMKIDIDRELNKAQAGGWLARFQEEDERVGAIKRGMDVAMGECEELDNLLTLYSVELSVSPRAPGRHAPY